MIDTSALRVRPVDYSPIGEGIAQMGRNLQMRRKREEEEAQRKEQEKAVEQFFTEQYKYKPEVAKSVMKAAGGDLNTAAKLMDFMYKGDVESLERGNANVYDKFIPEGQQQTYQTAVQNFQGRVSEYQKQQQAAEKARLEQEKMRAEIRKLNAEASGTDGPLTGPAKEIQSIATYFKLDPDKALERYNQLRSSTPGIERDLAVVSKYLQDGRADLARIAFNKVMGLGDLGLQTNDELMGVMGQQGQPSGNGGQSVQAPDLDSLRNKAFQSLGL